jgi:hypothetical protein
LNSLIERGWKPFHQEIKNKWWTRWNYPCEWAIKIRKNTIFISYRYESWNERINKWKKVQHSLRELVSAESWLWQFVCENGMVKKDRFTWMISPDPLWEDQYNYTDYRYRLIETALTDEDKLEQFLLDNIYIDE